MPKLRYGVSPSKFDLAPCRAEKGKRIESAATEFSVKLQINRLRANSDQFPVRVRELPARTVAYIRASNPILRRSSFASRQTIDGLGSKGFRKICNARKNHRADRQGARFHDGSNASGCRLVISSKNT